MEDFKNQIEERISNLKKLIKEKERELRHVPKGSVHIDKSGGRTQFYHYFNDKRSYLGKQDIVLLKRLLQKDYEEPLYLEQYGKVHPDFKILNVRLRKEMIWEHQEDRSTRK